GMVEHALIDLSQKNIVDLDPEQKSRLVSNLLVVLCSETETSPMINAGAM
ncbi:MAG: SPFH domain-containing protein, partial [Planctomycetota bacterium]|nr:SPFH domain-containing protein [Planctomycetota bacterium]